MKSIFYFLFITFTTLSYAIPARVMIIRHAEKPENGDELSAKGQERADALWKLFEKDSVFDTYGNPVAIYASPATSSSLRPVQTVTPLAKKLGLEINQSYPTSKISKMASEILADRDYDGKTVLICWSHVNVPAIAKAFGHDKAPSTWDGTDIFDRVWVLDFDSTGAISFKDLPQKLLPGDSES